MIAARQPAEQWNDGTMLEQKNSILLKSLNYAIMVPKLAGYDFREALW